MVLFFRAAFVTTGVSRRPSTVRRGVGPVRTAQGAVAEAAAWRLSIVLATIQPRLGWRQKQQQHNGSYFFFVDGRAERPSRWLRVFSVSEIPGCGRETAVKEGEASLPRSHRLRCSLTLVRRSGGSGVFLCAPGRKVSGSQSQQPKNNEKKKSCRLLDM